MSRSLSWSGCGKRHAGAIINATEPGKGAAEPWTRGGRFERPRCDIREELGVSRDESLCRQVDRPHYGMALQGWTAEDRQTLSTKRENPKNHVASIPATNSSAVSALNRSKTP